MCWTPGSEAPAKILSGEPPSLGGSESPFPVGEGRDFLFCYRAGGLDADSQRHLHRPLFLTVGHVPEQVLIPATGDEGVAHGFQLHRPGLQGHAVYETAPGVDAVL